MSKKQKQKYRELAKLDKMRFETELKQIVTLDSGDCETPDPPKKPLTPYMYFVRVTRPQVMKNMPNIPPLSIMKEVGNLWKKISEEELEDYKVMAKEDLKRFHREHQEFIQKINKQRQKSYAIQNSPHIETAFQTPQSESVVLGKRKRQTSPLKEVQKSSL